MPQSNPGPGLSQVVNLPLPVGNYQLIEELQLTLTPLIVATITTAEQSFGLNGVSQVTAATGILAGDTILAVNPPSSVAGVAVVGGRVDAAVNDKFYLEFVNPTAAGVTPPSGTYKIVVGRRLPSQLLTPLTSIQIGT